MILKLIAVNQDQISLDWHKPRIIGKINEKNFNLASFEHGTLSKLLKLMKIQEQETLIKASLGCHTWHHQKINIVGFPTVHHLSQIDISKSLSTKRVQKWKDS